MAWGSRWLVRPTWRTLIPHPLTLSLPPFVQVATMFAAMKDTDYGQNPSFRKNLILPHAPPRALSFLPSTLPPPPYPPSCRLRPCSQQRRAQITPRMRPSRRRFYCSKQPLSIPCPPAYQVATMSAAMKDTDYGQNPAFQRNLMSQQAPSHPLFPPSHSLSP